MRTLAVVVVGAAALATGAIVLWAVFFAGVSVSGSGGLGAVSVGISEIALPISLLASVLANRLFVRAARARGGMLRRVHQVHSVTLLLLTLTILSMFGFDAVDPHTGLWFVLIAALLFGLQFLLIGILLALFALSPRPASAS